MHISSFLFFLNGFSSLKPLKLQFQGFRQHFSLNHFRPGKWLENHRTISFIKWNGKYEQSSSLNLMHSKMLKSPSNFDWIITDLLFFLLNYLFYIFEFYYVYFMVLYIFGNSIESSLIAKWPTVHCAKWPSIWLKITTEEVFCIPRILTASPPHARLYTSSLRFKLATFWLWLLVCL